MTSADTAAAPTATTSPTAAPPGRRVTVVRVVGLAAVLVLLAAAPLGIAGSTVRVATSVLLFVTLAQAWNLIGGLAGYASFGNVVFFGLGGYTVAVLMAKLGWPFVPSIAVAALGAAGFAALFGTPILRLRGHYFAIATLGLAEATREVVLNIPSVTGGGAGLTIPAVGTLATVTYPGNTGFYYYALGLAVVTVAVAALISGSRFGYALRAIHMDENAAAGVGINTTRAKVIAFSVSGALTSVAGAVFAFQQVTIYPDRLFSVEITVLMVVMAVIGGAGTVAGPVVGAVGLQFLTEYLRHRYLGLHLVLFGLVMVVAVIFLPQGVVRFTGDAWRTRRVALLDTVRRYRL